MKCERCGETVSAHHARHGYTLCGICQLVESDDRVGLQTNDLVPAHFNHGLGEHIEGYDHLKRRRQELKREGLISDWD